MKSTWVKRGVLFATVAAFGLSSGGCGTSDQKYVEPSGSATETTPKQRVKEWLEGVAESGILDSGAMVMKEEVDKMKGEAGVDIAAIQKDMDDLLAQQSASAIRPKAKALSAKLGN